MVEKEALVNPVKPGEGDNSSSKDGKKSSTEKQDALTELSEEDKQLKAELEMLVERLKESDVDLHLPALEMMRTLIRTSTASMTSVPKPLKFLRPHYQTLKDLHEKMAGGSDVSKRFADILSVLAMTSAEEDSREALTFKLNGSSEALGSWGHEYVKHIAGKIGLEFHDRVEQEKPVDDLLKLTEEIVPFDMQHNAEAEACDLLMEIDHLELLTQFVDKEAFPRVTLYLMSCVNYVPEPEDTALLKTCLAIFRKFERYPESLQIAVQLKDMELIKEIFDSCSDASVQKQMALMLGRYQIYFDTGNEELNELISNSPLSSHFLSLARDLDVLEAKTPEDIYKSHLETTRTSIGAGVDSARQNLASNFVNGFVNAAFCSDKLMTEDGNKWIHKNKEVGMLCAAASLGLVHLWDVDGGLAEIDKYLYSNDEYIKAGSLLACGIINSGIRSEVDPAYALLADFLLDKNNIVRGSAIMGLGIAYAGAAREDFIDSLSQALNDTSSSMEVVGIASISLGLIFAGTCNGDVTSTILQTMLEKSPEQLSDPYAKFMALGLGLCYLGKQEAAEAVLAALKAVTEPYSRLASVLVDACAYMGTGNVLRVQNMLHICSEHFDKEKKEDDSHQPIAVLAIALIAMGEDIGAEMALRSFNHLLQYGETTIRRCVPLSLAMLCASNPKLSVLDTLSKLSHDSDVEVAANSILAMGIVGSGTNNSRIATLLRQLASFYSKEPTCLFTVRVAQGLLHLGKGTMSLSPYHSDRSVLLTTRAAGLLITLLAFVDGKSVGLSKSPQFLYYLAPAIRPRMLQTFDEDMKPLTVSVRVGQAVDTVGQAGKPKTITGFQTHTTPVLLAYGERAELTTDEYIPISPLLEGSVILRKNPEFKENVDDKKKKSVEKK